MHTHTHLVNRLPAAQSSLIAHLGRTQFSALLHVFLFTLTNSVRKCSRDGAVISSREVKIHVTVNVELL